MQVKTSWDGPWERYSFFHRAGVNTSLVTLPMLRDGRPRGVGKRKKRDIVTNLVPLMKNLPDGERRSRFWENLPTTAHAPDLSAERDLSQGRRTGMW